MDELRNLRKQLAEVTDCDCHVTDNDELDRCESHQRVYEVGRSLAHLPD